MKIEINLDSLNDLNVAFNEAIQKYKVIIETETTSDCIWDGSIKLIEIKFQDNFRRVEYIAIFEVIS